MFPKLPPGYSQPSFTIPFTPLIRPLESVNENEWASNDYLNQIKLAAPVVRKWCILNSVVEIKPNLKYLKINKKEMYLQDITLFGKWTDGWLSCERHLLARRGNSQCIVGILPHTITFLAYVLWCHGLKWKLKYCFTSP